MSGPAELCLATLASMPLPTLEGRGNKDERGRVLVVAGSEEVPGAAVLAAEAALRAGAGKLQIAVPAGLCAPVGLSVPEARVIALAEPPPGAAVKQAAAQSDAVVLGPGWIDEAWSRAVVSGLVRPGQAAMVVDAGALVLAAEAPERLAGLRGGAVLTPHAGEMAHVLGCEKAEVEADPLAAARLMSGRCGAVVAMKGAVTWIVCPDGREWRHGGGSIGLATSGSGDVLAGVIGGLLARGADPGQAAAWGVTLHGAAGADLGRSRGKVGFLARELPAEILRVMRDLDFPGAVRGAP